MNESYIHYTCMNPPIQQSMGQVIHTQQYHVAYSPAVVHQHSAIHQRAAAVLTSRFAAASPAATRWMHMDRGPGGKTAHNNGWSRKCGMGKFLAAAINAA